LRVTRDANNQTHLEADADSDGIRLFLRAQHLRTQGRTFAAIASQLAREGFKPVRRGARGISASSVYYLLFNVRLADFAAR
jgi:hypothetical protein